MNIARFLRVAAIVAALALLGACTGVRVRADQPMLDAQAARETALVQQTTWSISGKLGVSDGRDGGSGQVEWSERGDGGDFVLRAPVTGRSFELHVDGSQSVLLGLDQGPLHGGDAAALLREALGWEVPLDELRAWVRGMRAPGLPATLLFDAQGLPVELTQAGWTVQYRDWFTDRVPPLPRKVYAERAPYRVRLSIQHWDMP